MWLIQMNHEKKQQEIKFIEMYPGPLSVRLYRHTGRYTGRHTDIQTHRQIDR